MLSLDFILNRRMRLTLDLIPGPPHGDNALYSSAIQVIARYPAEQVAAAISMIPEVNVELDGTLDQRAWRWRWAVGDRTILIGFNTLDGITSGEKATWGGSSLEINAYVHDLTTFCINLRKNIPDIWLHFNGLVYTPQALVEHIHAMLEDQVITDIW